MTRIAASLVIVALATPALAHVGDHTGLSWSALIAHQLEAVHVPLVIAGILVGAFALRMSRKAAAATIHARKDHS
jgi:hypothetical protein